MVKAQYHKPVKVVRSDNGTEFVYLKTYFLKNGMIYQITIAGTPQKMDGGAQTSPYF